MGQFGQDQSEQWVVGAGVREEAGARVGAEEEACIKAGVETWVQTGVESGVETEVETGVESVRVRVGARAEYLYNSEFC